MLTEIFIAAMFGKKKEGMRPSRPGQYNYDQMQRYNTPRAQTPVNNPAPLPVDKTTETIPSGEIRSVFNSSAPGLFTLYSNPATIGVEVSEVLVIASVAGNVQLFLDETAITPILPLGINGSYSDSGFFLPANSSLKMNLPDTAVVSGFVRLRYR